MNRSLAAGLETAAPASLGVTTLVFLSIHLS